MNRHRIVSTLPATPTLPAVMADPAIPTLPAVSADPATATLPAVMADPTMSTPPTLDREWTSEAEAMVAMGPSQPTGRSGVPKSVTVGDREPFPTEKRQSEPLVNHYAYVTKARSVGHRRHKSS